MNKKLICMLFVLLSLMLTSCLFDDEEEEWSAAKVCPELGTNAKGMPNRGTFTDERDGRVYKYTTIGDQVWMAENLKYELPYPYSMCYGKEFCYPRRLWASDTVTECKTEDSKLAEIGQRMNTTCTTNECIADEYCEKYGRYYYLREQGEKMALLDRVLIDTICPKGWKLPSLEDFGVLYRAVDKKTIHLTTVEFPFYDETPGAPTADDVCGYNVHMLGLLNYEKKDLESLNKNVHLLTATAQTMYSAYTFVFTNKDFMVQVPLIMGGIRCLKD